MVKNVLPLTETVYYILMAFQKPTYGYLAIKDIEKMSLGKVRIAAGTMYGAIDTLLKNKMINQIPSEVERRKIYQTTIYGNEVLAAEVERMAHCIHIWQDKHEMN
ncbi:PadR family transcriptional regulator [Vagococcus silagei]|uniref:PadR family transcriptional regulator n=1 Tax=Vagococcus silagei TaxID=2508885 RepID=A0A4V3TV57_9ENTE|nr:PadR family transcriptional regulator [Vagococcus silagei]THB61549.1 PadR family transcriptional regulator [Vagococcus silagei]